MGVLGALKRPRQKLPFLFLSINSTIFFAQSKHRSAQIQGKGEQIPTFGTSVKVFTTISVCYMGPEGLQTLAPLQ